jgi:hypothetical protein
MSFKLNVNKLEHYAQVFAEKVCEEFYETNSKISGDQIKNLTPSPQVNIFIVYNLFEKWQEETSKLKSPFFDYDDKEVKESLTKFLNTLSMHISIEQEMFKPLIIKASFDALHWVFAPVDFIEHQASRGKLLNLDKIKELTKYIKVNNMLMGELISLLERQKKKEFSSEELVFYFSQVFLIKKDHVEDPYSIVSQFSSKISLDLNDLLPPSQQRMLTAFPEPAPQVAQIKEPAEEVKLRETKSADNTFEEEQKSPEKKEEAIDALAKEEPKAIYETFTKSQLSLNEMLMQNDNSLHKKLSKNKLNDIRSAISLNKKFLFINELFEGQSSEYDRALSEIEVSSNYNDALKLLNERYASKFKWTIGNPAMEEFFEIVERKFL